MNQGRESLRTTTGFKLCVRLCNLSIYSSSLSLHFVPVTVPKFLNGSHDEISILVFTWDFSTVNSDSLFSISLRSLRCEIHDLDKWIFQKSQPRDVLKSRSIPLSRHRQLPTLTLPSLWSLLARLPKIRITEVTEVRTDQCHFWIPLPKVRVLFLPKLEYRHGTDVWTLYRYFVV